MKGQVNINRELLKQILMEYIVESIKPMIYDLTFIQKFVIVAKDVTKKDESILNGMFEFNPNIMYSMLSFISKKLIERKQFNSPSQFLSTFSPEALLDMIDKELDNKVIEIPYFYHTLIVDFREGGKFNTPAPKILLRQQQHYDIPRRNFKVTVKEENDTVTCIIDEELRKTFKTIVDSTDNGYMDITMEANSFALYKLSHGSVKSYKEIFRECCDEIKQDMIYHIVVNSIEQVNGRYQKFNSDNVTYEINEMGADDNKIYLALLKYSI